MATSLPWFPAWDMEMAHKGIVKRNLGYTCTLINRCRALLQRLLHLVISETAPVYVAQLIKCFGVWKVKVCINQCIFIVWYRQNYILAFSLESGIICVSSFLNSLINVVLTYSTVFMRCFGKAAILYPYVKNTIAAWASSRSASRCALPMSWALRFDRL